MVYIPPNYKPLQIVRAVAVAATLDWMHQAGRKAGSKKFHWIISIATWFN